MKKYCWDSQITFLSYAAHKSIPGKVLGMESKPFKLLEESIEIYL